MVSNHQDDYWSHAPHLLPPGSSSPVSSDVAVSAQVYLQTPTRWESPRCCFPSRPLIEEAYGLSRRKTAALESSTTCYRPHTREI